jgi:hypothetical protein
MTEPVQPTTPPKAGLWEDFIDILHQPSQVFERRREGQFGLALLILVVLSAVLYFALRNGIGPVMDVEISRQMAEAAKSNPQLTEEQLAGSRGMMEKFAMFGAIIFLPIGVLIGGFLLWLASKIVDARIAFAAAMMIVTYSQVPRIIDLVLTALQGLFLPPESITSRYSVTLGPGRFMDPDSNPVLLTVLGNLDLITLWTLALMAIGLSVVARVTVKKGAIAAAMVWAVGMLPGLFQALRQG